LLADVGVLRVCFALNLAKQVRAVLNEKRVVKYNIVQGASSLVEVVHVKLPHEGVHVTVSEEAWEYLFFELLLVQDFETQAVVGPPDHGLGFFFFTNFEELEQKCGH